MSRKYRKITCNSCRWSTEEIIKKSETQEQKEYKEQEILLDMTCPECNNDYLLITYYSKGDL
jgi:hypothetical protein